LALNRPFYLQSRLRCMSQYTADASEKTHTQRRGGL
jgi:hypothetical protein